MDNRIIVRVDADLEDLIPEFLENRKKDLQHLRELLEKKDWEGIRSIGHTMKGIGGGYGFDGITEIGAALEQVAREQNLSAAQELLDRLEDYLDRVEVVFVEEDEI